MYDTLLVGIIAEQLNKELRGAKVEKVSQPEADEIILQLNTDFGRKKLLLSANPQGSRVHYTELVYENPAEAPVFCMLLRKHLQGGRIISVSHVEGERIIFIDVENTSDMGFSVSRRLVAETMGRHSNLILVDNASGKIMDSIKRVPVDISKVRQILPGQPYELPPMRESMLYGAVATEYADEAAVMAAVTEKGLCPAVYSDESGNPKDVHAVPLPKLEASMNTLHFDTVGQALDYFYAHKAETNRVLQKSNELLRTVKALIEKQQLKEQRLLEELKDSEESDIYRIKGELITANIHLIKPGAKTVTVTSFYDGSQVEIALDERYNAAKNAQIYFKKYSKLKSSAKEKREQLEECRCEIAYLTSQLGLIPNARSHEEIELIRTELVNEGHLHKKNIHERKYAKAFKPKPRRYTTTTGFEIAVGRNNVENDYLTFKVGGKTDYWFHTKDVPGSHVVLFTEGVEPDADTIYEVASIAAYFSQASDSENVPVDYVPLRYVKKPAGAKPGMVIFTNNRTVWMNPKAPNEDK